MGKEERGFATRAVHAGERQPPPEFVPTVTPVYHTTTYLYPAAEMDAIFGGTKEGYVYSRYGSPTVTAFEDAVASLEGAEGAVAYASGMAAIHGALFTCGLRAGDRVVASRDLYGATHALLQSILPEFGVTPVRVDATDTDAVRAALAAGETRLLLVEAVANPLLQVADVPALAGLCREHGAPLVVDATFVSPYLMRPLEHGADLVVHSATKYLAGHGDATAGVCAGPMPLVQKMHEQRKLIGGILSPSEASLAHRGMKTLPLRMERQCTNAARVAAWLKDHPQVARVHYPGLPEHPQHAAAARLLRPGAFGAMVSFEVAGGQAEAFRFLDSLRLCVPGTTLGDIYTLALVPSMSSHRALTPAERAAAGIQDSLVRLSVGIEDVEDIVADLEQALTASAGTAPPA